jgi:hemerythrin-like metal-binding protein
MELQDYVVWKDYFESGIPLIDEQHKTLFRLTNELYNACSCGPAVGRECFLNMIHDFVDYVTSHFSAEQELMETTNYPRAAEHKQQHDDFAKKVLQAGADLEQSKQAVALDFLHYLREWILSHIAIDDMDYVSHIKSAKNLETPEAFR